MQGINGSRMVLNVVDFREGGNPVYPEKNPRSTGEINYKELNSHGRDQPAEGALGAHWT